MGLFYTLPLSSERERRKTRAAARGESIANAISLARPRTGTRSARSNGVSRTPLHTAPLVALSFALLWSLGQVPVSGSAEPDIQRVLASFNTTAPPAYRAYRRMEAGLTDSDTKQG